MHLERKQALPPISSLCLTVGFRERGLRAYSSGWAGGFGLFDSLKRFQTLTLNRVYRLVYFKVGWSPI